MPKYRVTKEWYEMSSREYENHIIVEAADEDAARDAADLAYEETWSASECTRVVYEDADFESISVKEAKDYEPVSYPVVIPEDCAGAEPLF